MNRTVFKMKEVKEMAGCLIIHGYTGSPHEVAPLGDYLTAETDWDVVIPVLEGHGEELHLEEVSYETWLDDAERALLELKTHCDKVYVIGFSMGGMIAAYLAAKHDIDKLVLLSTARKYVSFKHLSAYIAEIVGDGFKGKLQENEWYLHHKGKIGDVPLKANIEFMKLVNHTKSYLKEVTSPVFIAQGSKDELVPFKTAYSIEKEIGSVDKEVVIFEESDHLICLGDDQHVLNEMIFEFLKQEVGETEQTTLS